MKELASNHAEVNTQVLDRIGDWKHYLKEAVLQRSATEGKQVSKAGTERLCVGIDLHKTQFTACALSETGEYLLEKKYLTKEEGYQEF